MAGRDDQSHRSFRTPARGTPVTDEETRRLAEVVAHAMGDDVRRKPVSGEGSGEWHTALISQMATVNATLMAQGAMIKETSDNVKNLQAGQQKVLLQLANGEGRMALIENNVGHMDAEQTRIDDELKLHLRRCSGGMSGSRNSVRGEDNKASGGWISAAALPKILLAVGSMTAAIIGAFYYGFNHAAPSAQTAPVVAPVTPGPPHP